MNRTSPNLSWNVLVIIAAGIAGCTTSSSGEQGRPTSSRLAYADEWADAIYDLGKFPVIPPTEDMYVGDVFAFSAPPEFASTKTADGLRTAATPRWKSLQVLTQLETEYRQRPAWNHTAEARRRATPDDPNPGAAGDVNSLYRTDSVPVRHRIVGLRSMANLTLNVPDLESLIPIEIAPLIEGPATPERLAVSIQAGEAEIYALSVNALIEQLLDPADGGSRFTLKPEHLRNLPLVADQNVGKVYVVAITEVLYMRSIEATVRRRQETPADASTDAATEPVEPATAGQAPDREDPATAAIHRAVAMNEAFGESGIEDRIGGSIKIVMATDDALTLRRRWPYPLAVAVRGITVEVEVSTGNVLRMAPLGIELPELPPPPKPPSGAPPEGG